MHIKFKILRRVYPKLFEDFTDYIICGVRVIDCSKASLIGKDLTYKGYLPSCAPYFIFESDGGVIERYDDAYRQQVLCNANKSARFVLHEDLRVDGLIHMLTHEFPRTNVLYQKDTVKRHTTESALCAIQEMVRNGDIAYDSTRKIDVRFISALPMMHEAVLDACDLFRVGYIEPIVGLYAKQSGKVYKQLSRLSATQLQELNETLDSDPLTLCFKSGSRERFALSPLSYDSFIVQAKRKGVCGRYKPYELCAVRILDYLRQTMKNDSAATFDDLKHGYIQKHAHDVCRFDQAFWSLVRANELHYDDGTVSGVKSAAKCQIIVDTLHRLFTNGDAKHLYRDLNEGVPCIPKTLTDEQTRAATHMLRFPLTMVIGAPGRGKTSLVEFGACYFARPCIVSFVGTNVAAHRERINGRKEMSNTAHYVYHTAKNVGHGKEWAAAFTALIWDEFSNVSESLCADLLSVLIAVVSFTMILDPWQIHPLKTGMPGIDLIDRYPQHCCTLTTNLRTNPNARYMADAIIHVLKGEPQHIEWSHDIRDLECMTLIDTRKYNVHINDDISLTDRPLRACIHDLLQHIMRHRNVYNVHDIMDIQFVTFKKKIRDILNHVVEDCARTLGLLPTTLPHSAVALRPSLTLYVGAKICIRGESFGAPRESLVAYDTIRNGDCGIITALNVLPDARGTDVTFTLGALDKRMLINKYIHVDPAAVHLGHCITCNAAQGSEYKTVIGVLHDGSSNAQWITRGHAHVMSSRAKDAFILMGDRPQDAFERICMRVERKRTTKLAQLLKKLHEPDMARDDAPDICDPGTLTLAANKKIPCVPILEDFKPPPTESHHKRQRN